MKLLMIDESLGYYRDPKGKYVVIDKLTKEHLLALVDCTLEEADVEFDKYSEDTLANQAHQIVYKNVYEKLRVLYGRRQEFVDESQRLYLQDYEKYRNGTPDEER